MGVDLPALRRLLWGKDRIPVDVVGGYHNVLIPGLNKVMDVAIAPSYRGQHRIHLHCGCGVWMPAGRYIQHKKACKATHSAPIDGYALKREGCGYWNHKEACFARFVEPCLMKEQMALRMKHLFTMADIPIVLIPLYKSWDGNYIRWEPSTCE